MLFDAIRRKVKNAKCGTLKLKKMLQMAPDYPLIARSLLRRDRPIVRITAIHTQQPTAGGGERGGHNLKQERFRLGTKKHFSTLRAARQWNRLPREAA